MANSATLIASFSCSEYLIMVDSPVVIIPVT